MSDHKAEAMYLAGEAAELAAEIRRQDDPAHNHQREVWARNADRPEREKKSRMARGLDAFLRACKFTPDEITTLWPVLWVVLKVADGADREEYFVLPDAVAGAMLESWPAADVEDLRRRGKSQPDYDRLARAWVRAVERCAPAFARTELCLFDRKHGYKTATGNVASKVCAPFVQWLVDVDKHAASLRVRSVELRYQRAAESVVRELPRQRAEQEDRVFKCPACQRDNCPHTRAHVRRQKEPTAADRCVNFLTKLPALIDKMLADVPAELRADLYEPARKLLQARLTGEVEEESDQGNAQLSTIDQKEQWTDSAPPEGALGSQTTQAPPAAPAKNAAAEQIRVDKNVTHKLVVTPVDFNRYAQAVRARAHELQSARGLNPRAAEEQALFEFGSAEQWLRGSETRADTGAS